MALPILEQVQGFVVHEGPGMPPLVGAVVVLGGHVIGLDDFCHFQGRGVPRET